MKKEYKVIEHLTYEQMCGKYKGYWLGLINKKMDRANYTFEADIVLIGHEIESPDIVSEIHLGVGFGYLEDKMYIDKPGDNPDGWR